MLYILYICIIFHILLLLVVLCTLASLFIRKLMAKLKASFREVMLPDKERQLDNDILVKTMKVGMRLVFVNALYWSVQSYRFTAHCSTASYV